MARPNDRNPRTGRPGAAALLGWALPALVAVVAFAAFGPALEAGFVDWDDRALLIDNQRYRGLGADHLAWMFSTTLLGHYQPLTWLSFAIDRTLWGDDPAGYHLVNLLLHAASAVLVYIIAIRLLRAGFGSGAAPAAPTRAPTPATLQLAAAFAALLFAAHPLRVESVAWVTERRDVLSGALLLGAFLTYLRAFPPETKRAASLALYAASIALLLLSLLAKAWGMTFFVVALVADWYPLRRLPPDPRRWLAREHRPVLLQKIPYALLGVPAAAMAGYAQRSAPGAMRDLADWGVTERLVQAFYGLAFYVRKTIWPTNLSPLYELPPVLDPAEPRFLLSIAGVAVAGLAIWALRGRIPALLAAAAAYGILIAPVLGIAQSGDQLVADRYSYLSGIPLAILAAAGLVALARRFPRWRAPLTAVSALVLAVLVVMAWLQSRVWHDSLSLWTQAVRAAPSAGTHTNLALNLHRAGRRAEAVEHYALGLQHDPRDGRAWYALGNALKELGRPEEAERAYLEAIKHLPQAYIAQVNLGALYRDQGRHDEALAMFRAAVESAEAAPPGLFSPLPYLPYGVALQRAGRIDEARAVFTKAAAHEQTRRDALRHLANFPGGG